MKKTVSVIMLTLLFIGMLTLAFNIQQVKASETIYIMADGSVEPEGTPISSVDNITYTFTDNIYCEIFVERDNIVVDGAGYTLQETEVANLVGIDLSLRCNVTISNVEIKGFEYGIFGVYSFNNTISGNIVINNLDGILLDKSSDNTISGNKIAANSDCGILLGRSFNTEISENKIADNKYGVLLLDSLKTTIVGNNITNNVDAGIWLFDSPNNTIVGNNMTNNDYGIYLYKSSNNKIYHNNFIDNKNQTFMQDVYTNIWDNGYPSGGNYWSDYVGVDFKSGLNQDLPGSDCIGDTPYIIDANNTDHYPLMNPYGAPPPPKYALTITTTVGGTTDPASGTYSYTADSTVQVTAIPDAGYLFDYWELDDVSAGSVNPYSVLMDTDYMLKAVFSPIPPPLSASIIPLSASINLGQSVTFTSTVSGGYTPYSCQWYLNGNPVSEVTSNTWIFQPTTSRVYYVYLKVTDAKDNTTQSETARITVAAVPIGGYSLPIERSTKASPLTQYLTFVVILAIILTAIKRKVAGKTKSSPK